MKNRNKSFLLIYKWSIVCQNSKGGRQNAYTFSFAGTAEPMTGTGFGRNGQFGKASMFGKLTAFIKHENIIFLPIFISS